MHEHPAASGGRAGCEWGQEHVGGGLRDRPGATRGRVGHEANLANVHHGIASLLHAGHAEGVVRRGRQIERAHVSPAEVLEVPRLHDLMLKDMLAYGKRHRAAALATAAALQHVEFPVGRRVGGKLPGGRVIRIHPVADRPLMGQRLKLQLLTADEGMPGGEGDAAVLRCRAEVALGGVQRG